MTLTLEISPRVQRELTREAEVRGVDVPVLAARLLEDAVSLPALATPVANRRSHREIRVWLDSLTEFSNQIPAMPAESFSRRMIYHDHD